MEENYIVRQNELIRVTILSMIVGACFILFVITLNAYILIGTLIIIGFLSHLLYQLTL